MERKTRLWLGLGAAVLVGGTVPGHTTAPTADGATGGGRDRYLAQPVRLAQAEGAAEGGEGGEGEGGEGGGQILGTITEFRLNSTDAAAFQYDSSRQVAAYGAVVHQRYLTAHEGALRLQEAVATLLRNPGQDSLAAARAAWVNARAAYMQTEAFLFYAGPIDGEGGPISRIDAWPVDEAFIDYVDGKPNSGIVNDLSIPINRATLVKLDQAADPANVTTGWHAIEFLLWGEDAGIGGPGTRLHTDYLSGQGNNDRRREYLRIVTQLLVNDLSTLIAAWAPGTNNYRGSIAAMDQRNAIGRAFNGMAVLAGYEMALKRIGGGLRRPGEEYESSRFSDTTTSDFINDLRGIRAVYFGEGGDMDSAGFDALLAKVDPAANARVIATLGRAEEAVAVLDTPYDGILASPRGSPARIEAETAASALKDLAVALRAAGNRLGVLVLIPGL